MRRSAEQLAKAARMSKSMPVNFIASLADILASLTGCLCAARQWRDELRNGDAMVVFETDSGTAPALTIRYNLSAAWRFTSMTISEGVRRLVELDLKKEKP